MFNYIQKLCSFGKCIEDEKAPLDDCVYGEDILTKFNSALELPEETMSCQSFFDHVASKNISPKTYCLMPHIASICCKTCPSN